MGLANIVQFDDVVKSVLSTKLSRGAAYGLNADAYAGIWQSFCDWLVVQLKIDKGVHVPDFGKFAFVEKRLGQSVFVKYPVYVLHPTDGLEQKSLIAVSNRFPSLDINFATISSECGLRKEVINAGLRDLYMTALQLGRKPTARRVIFPFWGIGVLEIERGIVSFDFGELLEGDGSADDEKRGSKVTKVNFVRPGSQQSRPQTSSSAVSSASFRSRSCSPSSLSYQPTTPHRARTAASTSRLSHQSFASTLDSAGALAPEADFSVDGGKAAWTSSKVVSDVVQRRLKTAESIDALSHTSQHPLSPSGRRTPSQAIPDDGPTSLQWDSPCSTHSIATQVPTPAATKCSPVKQPSHNFAGEPEKVLTNVATACGARSEEKPSDGGLEASAAIPSIGKPPRSPSPSPHHPPATHVRSAEKGNCGGLWQHESGSPAERNGEKAPAFSPSNLMPITDSQDTFAVGAIIPSALFTGHASGGWDPDITPRDREGGRRAGRRAVRVAHGLSPLSSPATPTPAPAAIDTEVALSPDNIRNDVLELGEGTAKRGRRSRRNRKERTRLDLEKPLRGEVGRPDIGRGRYGAHYRRAKLAELRATGGAGGAPAHTHTNAGHINNGNNAGMKLYSPNKGRVPNPESPSSLRAGNNSPAFTNTEHVNQRSEETQSPSRIPSPSVKLQLSDIAMYPYAGSPSPRLQERGKVPKGLKERYEYGLEKAFERYEQELHRVEVEDEKREKEEFVNTKKKDLVEEAVASERKKAQDQFRSVLATQIEELHDRQERERDKRDEPSRDFMDLRREVSEKFAKAQGARFGLSRVRGGQGLVIAMTPEQKILQRSEFKQALDGQCEERRVEMERQRKYEKKEAEALLDTINKRSLDEKTAADEMQEAVSGMLRRVWDRQRQLNRATPPPKIGSTPRVSHSQSLRSRSTGFPYSDPRNIARPHSDSDPKPRRGLQRTKAHSTASAGGVAGRVAA
eukprot:Rmarinus@m.22141